MIVIVNDIGILLRLKRTHRKKNRCASRVINLDSIVKANIKERVDGTKFIWISIS